MSTQATASQPSRTRAAGPLAARVGERVIAPGRALRWVDGHGGAFNDSLALVLLGALAFRLPELIQAILAILGPTSGAFVRLVGIVAAEVQDAAAIVLPAALAVTALAGERRDPSRDLELGSACYPAFFAIRALAGATDAVAGERLVPTALVWILGGTAAAAVTVRAILVARTRPLPERRGTPIGPATGAAAPATKTQMETETAGVTEAAGTTAPAGQASDATSAETPTAGASARRAGGLLAALAAVALAGNAAWSAARVETLRPMKRGQEAPDFTLPRLDGAGAVSLSGLRGQVVVLDFWATWCSPCVAMVPVLDRVHASFSSRGVAFVGVNSDGGGAAAPEIQEFVLSHHVPYPVVVDDGHVGAEFKVEALPTLMVLGRDGRIRQSFVGYTAESTLAKALRDAIDAPN